MPLRVAPRSQCTSLHVAIPHAAAQYAEAWIGLLRRTSFDSVKRPSVLFYAAIG
jgi:hypothetical protein